MIEASSRSQLSPSHGDQGLENYCAMSIRINCLMTIGVLMLAVSVISAELAKAPIPPVQPRTLSEVKNNTAPPCTTISNNYLINRRQRPYSSYLWSDLVVTIQPDIAFDAQELETINEAVWLLQKSVPCLSFLMWPPDSKPIDDYVHIVKVSNKSGCSSDIGRQGGRQVINLEPACVVVGVVIHQLIHALGFDHEHNRSDRDESVTIHWENIDEGYSRAFYRNHPKDFDTYEVPYSKLSIMHYGSYDFSSNGKFTITTKEDKVFSPDGQLKPTDVMKIHKMYNCSISESLIEEMEKQLTQKDADESTEEYANPTTEEYFTPTTEEYANLSTEQHANLSTEEYDNLSQEQYANRSKEQPVNPTTEMDADSSDLTPTTEDINFSFDDLQARTIDLNPPTEQPVSPPKQNSIPATIQFVNLIQHANVIQHANLIHHADPSMDQHVDPPTLQLINHGPHANSTAGHFPDMLTQQHGNLSTMEYVNLVQNANLIQHVNQSSGQYINH